MRFSTTAQLDGRLARQARGKPGDGELAIPEGGRHPQIPGRPSLNDELVGRQFHLHVDIRRQVNSLPGGTVRWRTGHSDQSVDIEPFRIEHYPCCGTAAERKRRRPRRAHAAKDDRHARKPHLALVGIHGGREAERMVETRRRAERRQHGKECPEAGSLERGVHKQPRPRVREIHVALCRERGSVAVRNRPQRNRQWLALDVPPDIGVDPDGLATHRHRPPDGERTDQRSGRDIDGHAVDPFDRTRRIAVAERAVRDPQRIDPQIASGSQDPPSVGGRRGRRVERRPDRRRLPVTAAIGKPFKPDQRFNHLDIGDLDLAAQQRQQPDTQLEGLQCHQFEGGIIPGIEDPDIGRGQARIGHEIDVELSVERQDPAGRFLELRGDARLEAIEVNQPWKGEENQNQGDRDATDAVYDAPDHGATSGAGSTCADMSGPAAMACQPAAALQAGSIPALRSR